MKVLLRDARFCASCGGALNSEGVSDAPKASGQSEGSAKARPTRGKPKPRAIVVAAIALVCVIGAVGAAAAIARSQSDDAKAKGNRSSSGVAERARILPLYDAAMNTLHWRVSVWNARQSPNTVQYQQQLAEAYSKAADAILAIDTPLNIATEWGVLRDALASLASLHIRFELALQAGIMPKEWVAEQGPKEAVLKQAQTAFKQRLNEIAAGAPGT